jgi:hypothetical protein
MLFQYRSFNSREGITAKHGRKVIKIHAEVNSVELNE